MKIRHRWLWLATLLPVILGVGIGWLMSDREGGPPWVDGSGIDSVSLPETAATQPEFTEPGPADGDRFGSVAMPPIERAQLARDGVLTNADRPIDTLSRDPAVIMLRNAIIDTEVLRRGGLHVGIPERYRARADHRQAIVVFDEPLDPKHWELIEACGARMENYVPNRALAVSGPHDALERLRAAPGVRHVEPFHPFYKMSRDIQAHLTDAEADPDTRARAASGRYHVLLFGEPDAVLAAAATPSADTRRLPAIDAFPGAIPESGALGIAGARLRPLPTLPGRQAVAEIEIDPDNLPDLVLSDAIKWIEPVPRFEVMNDLGRRSTRQARTRAVYPNLTGSNVVIGVVDTGADTNHPALAGRVVAYSVKDGPTSDGLIGDAKGHGTHVLGTILGNGVLSDTVASAPGSDGPPYGELQFSGMATNARYVMIEDFNSYTHNEMAWEAYRPGRDARIANNSWGAATNFDYGIASMYWDAIVRDVNWGEVPLLPYTVFFAGGNRGEGNTDGSGGIQGTVSQPGNAKNVITIGAIEQKRDADNLTEPPFSSLEATDSEWQVAAYSGRGRVLGSDRRVKPDLVAPGEYVLSLQSSAINTDIVDEPLDEQRDFNAGNVDTGPRYAFMSGTSRATAFASGAAALLRQHYYQTIDPGNYPSPAMLKALLINGARNLHGAAYEWGPRRDGEDLTVGNINHAGVVTNQVTMLARWPFPSNSYLPEPPSIHGPSGTNIYLAPNDVAFLPSGIPNHSVPAPLWVGGADGFGQCLRFNPSTWVRFEMQTNRIAEGWHLANQVRTIEFWILRDPGQTSDEGHILGFESEVTEPQVRLASPYIVYAQDMGLATEVYVNGSSLTPVLDEGWNHVVVLPANPIIATNFTLGRLNADIDELRFHDVKISTNQIYHNYTNGLAYVIRPSEPLIEQLGGMHRETAIRDGWGQLDLAGAVLGPQTFTNSLVSVRESQVAAGVIPWSEPFAVTPAQARGSLKITLVWTDIHGTPNTGPILVNNLDLQVRYKPDTKDEVIYLGNFLGRQTWGAASYPIVIRESGEFQPMAVTPGQFAVVDPIELQDRRQLNALRDNQNNVEQIIIRDLLPGTYLVEVLGVGVSIDYNDPSQSLIREQPFALVINRGVSSAGEAMGAEPALAIDTNNVPVLAYSTVHMAEDLFAGTPERRQIAVRRWIDSHTNLWPDWERLENKWFHYGDGAYREIVSRGELGSAESPSLTFDSSNTLYLAWVQKNNAQNMPDAIYLRYLTAARQAQAWNNTNRWEQLGVSYQDLGISGSNILEHAAAPTVRIAWDDQPVVAYRQGGRVLVKKWSTNALAWRGLDGSVTGLVASTVVSNTPVRMDVDAYGHPVLVWRDAVAERLRIVRWDGSQWRAVAGGALGDATATDPDLVCDRSVAAAIAVTWISSDGGTPSVRAARTTVGGASWRGLPESGAANSMVHPGICGATNAVISATRAAFTPGGNLMISWLAEDDDGNNRQLLRKYDGIQWGGLSGSARLSGIYDTLGALDQPALISDTNGFPIVALRGERTGWEEIHVLRAQQIDVGDADPDASTPAPPPVLTGTNVFGIDGAYQFGDVVRISVQFPTNVTVIGTPTIELNTVPINRYAYYASNSTPDTLVFHYTVSIGDTANPLDYTGSDALRLNGGAFIVDSDWYFQAAIPNPGGPGALSDNNAIDIDGIAYSLAVASAWGTVNPARGTSWYANNALITADVLDSPVAQGATTQFVAVAWVGSGSVPADPVQNHPNVFFETQNTNLSFNLGANSTLAWQWATNYWLETAVDGPGTLDVASDWRKRDVDVVITATDAGQPFGYWTGDTNGCTIVANVITVPIDRTRSITAVFNPHKLVVASEYGVPTPPVGVHEYVHNSRVNASMDGSPVTLDASMQVVAVGWIGVGSVPDAPAQEHPDVFFTTQHTEVAFNMTNYSTLTWQWATNYWLATAAAGPGSVDIASGWRKQGVDVELTATADAGRQFIGWIGDTEGSLIDGHRISVPMDRARHVTAAFDRLLTVDSAHGTPHPAVGVHGLAHGSQVDASVADSPATLGGTQVVAVGWTGTGSVPAAPDPDHPEVFFSTQNTNLSFTIDADSALTWQWATNYWVETLADGAEGTVSVWSGEVAVDAPGWVAQGRLTDFMAEPADGHEFAYWRVNGVSNEVASLAIAVESALRIEALFAPAINAAYTLAIERGISAEWLDRYFPDATDPIDPDADHDGDGMTLYEEYIAGTDPLDSRSALYLSQGTAASDDGGVLLSWPAVEDRIYTVQYTRCVTEPWQILADLPYDGETMTMIDNGVGGGDLEPVRLYRISVRIDETK